MDLLDLLDLNGLCDFGEIIEPGILNINFHMCKTEMEVRPSNVHEDKQLGILKPSTLLCS